jgi:hypothetical protein
MLYCFYCYENCSMALLSTRAQQSHPRPPSAHHSSIHLRHPCSVFLYVPDGKSDCSHWFSHLSFPVFPSHLSLSPNLPAIVMRRPFTPPYELDEPLTCGLLARWSLYLDSFRSGFHSFHHSVLVLLSSHQSPVVYRTHLSTRIMKGKGVTGPITHSYS